MTRRCAAHQPRFAPFHLRFHPLLRRSFGFSFRRFSFSPSASSYLHRTHFVNRVPLLFRFSSYLLPFPPCFLPSRPSLYPDRLDISITIFAAPLRMFALPYLSAFPRALLRSDFTLANDSAEIPPRPVARSRSTLYWTNRSENGELLSRSTPQNPSTPRIRHDTACSGNCLRPRFISLLLLLFFLHRPNLSPGKYRVARTWQPSIRTRATEGEAKSQFRSSP